MIYLERIIPSTNYHPSKISSVNWLVEIRIRGIRRISRMMILTTFLIPLALLHLKIIRVRWSNILIPKKIIILWTQASSTKMIFLWLLGRVAVRNKIICKQQLDSIKYSKLQVLQIKKAQIKYLIKPRDKDFRVSLLRRKWGSTTANKPPKILMMH